jgi:hypothetical protein
VKWPDEFPLTTISRLLALKTPFPSKFANMEKFAGQK